MRIEIFSQGEGPINTLGGLFGTNKILKLNMTTVGIFRRNNNGLYSIHNWNGDISPVVHQYDRYEKDYFKHGAVEDISVLKMLGGNKL